MFREIIGDLYIGKSKLTFICNNKVIPQTELVKDVMSPTSYTGNMPDYFTYGNILDQGFEITPVLPSYTIYLTGIPKGAILDNYRIARTFWSSYYEDDIRGYLFQIAGMGIPRMLIKQK